MKSKQRITTIMFILFSLLLSVVYAAPGIPHQFYGAVTVNGNPATDGLLIIAEIDGTQVAATQVRGSSYGYAPYTFYITQPEGVNREGKKIIFYVDGIKAAEFTFSTGQSTTLDLAISKDVPPTQNSGGGTTSTSSSGSAPSGGGGMPSTPKNTTNTTLDTTAATTQSQCTPNWECSNWLDCTNMVQTRTCVDKNDCGTFEAKPEVQRICENQKQVEALIASQSQDLNEANKGFFEKITGKVVGANASPMVLPALIAILVVAIILGLLYMRFKRDDHVY